jgi:hypothetical protein
MVTILDDLTDKDHFNILVSMSQNVSFLSFLSWPDQVLKLS